MSPGPSPEPGRSGGSSVSSGRWQGRAGGGGAAAVSKRQQASWAQLLRHVTAVMRTLRAGPELPAAAWVLSRPLRPLSITTNPGRDHWPPMPVTSGASQGISELSRPTGDTTSCGQQGSQGRVASYPGGSRHLPLKLQGKRKKNRGQEGQMLEIGSEDLHIRKTNH